jgi:hypothetical protein
MSKRIAMYGSFVAKKPVFQRYWKMRTDGVKQRYWIKTTRYKNVVLSSGRYEFHGKGRDLVKAVIQAQKIMPNGYVDVSATQFLANPEKYGTRGFWIDREVISG